MLLKYMVTLDVFTRKTVNSVGKSSPKVSRFRYIRDWWMIIKDQMASLINGNPSIKRNTLSDLPLLCVHHLKYFALQGTITYPLQSQHFWDLRIFRTSHGGIGERFLECTSTMLGFTIFFIYFRPETLGKMWAPQFWPATFLAPLAGGFPCHC